MAVEGRGNPDLQVSVLSGQAGNQGGQISLEVNAERKEIGDDQYPVYPASGKTADGFGESGFCLQESDLHLVEISGSGRGSSYLEDCLIGRVNA